MLPDIERLRSHKSLQRTIVGFINRTNRDISVEWVDTSGNHVCYLPRLQPNKGVIVHTCIGHPWVFYNTDTRRPLLTSPWRQRVFFPEPVRRGSIQKVEVINPVLSLRQACLETIHRHISELSGHVSKEDFEIRTKRLGLPASMSEDLEQLLHEQHHKNMPLYIMPDEA